MLGSKISSVSPIINRLKPLRREIDVDSGFTDLPNKRLFNFARLGEGPNQITVPERNQKNAASNSSIYDRTSRSPPKYKRLSINSTKMVKKAKAIPKINPLSITRDQGSSGTNRRSAGGV
jgi:hypothetical protein